MKLRGGGGSVTLEFHRSVCTPVRTGGRYVSLERYVKKGRYVSVASYFHRWTLESLGRR